MVVLLVWILTVIVIFDEVQFQTRKSNSRSGEYKFLSLKVLRLKLLDFPLLNPFQTLSDINSSPKPLASDEFASSHNNGDQYRPV